MQDLVGQIHRARGCGAMKGPGKDTLRCGLVEGTR